MKKFLAALFMLSLAKLSLALPADPEKVIMALSSHPDYQRIISENRVQGVRVSVMKVVTGELKRKCREDSRSASYVKVVLELGKPRDLIVGKTYYFSTSERPEDLAMCSDE